MTAMEALLDETEAAAKRIRGIYEKWENLRKAQQAYIQELEGERDALRAKLDSMTIERRPTWEPEQRLVGPWAPVEGEPEPDPLGPPRDLNPAFLRRDK